jgi:toxin ParE1/3/4
VDVHLNPDLQAKLSRLAAQQGRASEALVIEAVERMVNYDEWFLREVDKGLAAADRGELVDHSDVTQICDYIDQHRSGAAARRIALAIHHSIDLLVEFPEYGRTGRKPGTRELVFSGLPYLAVYRIHGDAVEIVRIFHGAQDWTE